MSRSTFFSMIFLAFAATLAAQPQTPPCGMSPEDVAELNVRLLQNLEALRNNPNPLEFRTVRNVPLTFHMVANTDASGRVAELDVFEQLCALNEDYAGMDIQFYIKKLNYINNSTVHQTHANAFPFMQFQRDLGSVNIWIVQDATPAGDGLGTTLGYYSPGFDWIVMRKDEIGDGASLSHELGHYFSLDHPFNGWDFEPYDPAIHGTPAPATSPGGVPTEKQDGSNCATAGDYLCDTAPDYNLGFGWPNCNYTGGAKDPMNVVIDPDEKLFMGYFLNCPRAEYYFSSQQQQLINQDLSTRATLPIGNIRRVILSSTFNFQVITQVPQLVYPINNEVTPGYNSVTFTWNGVPGSDAFILEVSRLPNMSVLSYTDLVFGTSKTVTNLQADKSYYWRIKPLNYYYACAPFTATGLFKTGTATSINDLPFVSEWSVSPNPVADGAQLFVNVESSQLFNSEIALYSATGQAVKVMNNQAIVPGKNSIVVPVNDLQAGVYFLSLQTTEGRLTQRVVVQ